MKLDLFGIVGLVVAAGLVSSCGGSPSGVGSDGSDGGPRSRDAAQAESLLDADGTSESDAAQAPVDAGATDASAMDAATDAAATDASKAASCRDDSPPPGVPFLQGGSTCTLPDGGMGFGSGAYGCVDPTVCHCNPVAGDATCVQLRLQPSDTWTNGVCIYASCNGADQGQSCTLSDGTTGSCCLETCQKLDTRNDPNNCGGCSFACSQGLACVSGQCGNCASAGFCPCTGVVCPAGRVCAAALCNGSTCSACVEASCGAAPDGTPCAIPTDGGGNTGAVHAGYDTGICCNHECGDPQKDNRNCGGCGVTCCSGKQCSAVSGLIAAECL